MKPGSVILFLLAVTAVRADIGENFKASSYIIGGNAYILLAEDYALLSLNPGFEKFIADNISLSLDPSYQYQSSGWGNAHYLGVLGGLKYYMVTSPAARRGIVHSVGGSVGLGTHFSSGSSATLNITLSPGYRFYYFLTDRIAPYLGVTLDGVFDVSNGNFDMSTLLIGGISFHFPSRDYVMPK